MYADVITLLNFILGMVTVVLSLTVALLFAFRATRFKPNGKNRGFSWALCLQLIGEAVIGGGTLLFAAAAYYDVLKDWSVELQSMIRFLMFLATSVTTVHLYRTIRDIQNS